MSEIKLFNRWTIQKKRFWLILGVGIPVLCILLFLVISLFPVGLGSMGGYAYDTANSNFGYAPEMEAAMEPMVEEQMSRESLAVGFDSDDMSANTNGSAVMERLIIREGNLTIVVENTIDSRDRIDSIVAELSGQGAYVVTSSESGRGENRQPYISMVIRVPVQEFDSVMDQIADMGVRVDERYENAQDVTDEYVDLEGRIDAMEVSIERLKELMRDASFTEDLLNAEEQLSRREAELEALQGRLNFLAQSADLSRINITLTPYELSEPIDSSWKPAETFRRSLENLLESMQDFADFAIIFGISVLPWLVFFGLIIWGVVALVRRRRRKNQARAEQQNN